MVPCQVIPTELACTHCSINQRLTGTLIQSGATIETKLIQTLNVLPGNAAALNPRGFIRPLM